MIPTKDCHRTILVVEDDVEIRDLLQYLLGMEGYEVHSAKNGLEGIRALDSLGGACVILLDLMMPVMDGWEFLREKVAHAAVAGTPVVVMTALDQVGVPEGVRELIHKPLKFATILGTVRQYCSASVANPGSGTNA